MAQNHVALLPAAVSLNALSLPVRRFAAATMHEPHVVVATQNLPRMSNSIQALMRAGYLVTAYASPSRLLPRLQRLGSHPVSLLIIDGGLTPALARAAALAAASLYADLPIILLVTESAMRFTERMPPAVSMLHLPLSEPTLLVTAAALSAQRARMNVDDPPDAA